MGPSLFVRITVLTPSTLIRGPVFCGKILWHQPQNERILNKHFVQGRNRQITEDVHEYSAQKSPTAGLAVSTFEVSGASSSRKFFCRPQDLAANTSYSRVSDRPSDIQTAQNTGIIMRRSFKSQSLFTVQIVSDLVLLILLNININSNTHWITSHRLVSDSWV